MNKNTHHEENEKVENIDSKNDDMYSDEIQIEDITSEETIEALQKKMREKLRVCEQEKKEYLDGWQRMRADFANARKEEELRRTELIKFASEGLVEDLLPVLDSFSMAFANKEAWEKVDPNWRKGVEYIHAQLFSVLESRGLAEVGALGDTVDPRSHVEIGQVPVDNPEQVGKVVEVTQKGYRLHSKIIRPAQVKGGKGKE